jgi:hypothetical protein
MAENIVQMPLERPSPLRSRTSSEHVVEGNLGELLLLVQRLLAERVVSMDDIQSLNRTPDLRRALGALIGRDERNNLGVRCIGALSNEGLSETAIGYALRDPEFRGRLRRFWERREEPTNFGASPAHRRAEAIVGTDHFVSPCDAGRHFGFSLSRDWHRQFADFPFDPAEMRAKTGFAFLPDLGLSIVEMYQRHPQGFWAPHGLSIEDEAFASQPGEPGWKAVRKQVLKYSWGHGWNLQRDIVSSRNEDVPDARLTVYALMLLQATNKMGEWQPDIGVRTGTTTADGGRVYVYFLPGYGCLLGIERDGEETECKELGVHSMLRAAT